MEDNVKLKQIIEVLDQLAEDLSWQHPFGRISQVKITTSFQTRTF